MSHTRQAVTRAPPSLRSSHLNSRTPLQSLQRIHAVRRSHPANGGLDRACATARTADPCCPYCPCCPFSPCPCPAPWAAALISAAPSIRPDAVRAAALDLFAIQAPALAWRSTSTDLVSALPVTTGGGPAPAS